MHPIEKNIKNENKKWNPCSDATGWRPKFSLDDGIRELIKGYEILKTPRWANA